MLTTAHRSFLSTLFPGDAAAFSPEELAPFGVDASRLSGQPWAVVRPQTAEQLSELLAWAHTERIPIYPRARGTNVVGATVPAGGVVVSMLRMNRVVTVSPEDFLAVVEPGVVTGDFRRLVASQGLFYPPDPGSVNISTLGGNVATNAGGMSAVRYGITRDYVLGIEAVVPGGQRIRTGGSVHKDVVGLDLTRLLVGSEGTLALFTSLTMKLLPKPEATATLLACFPDLDTGLAAVQGVFRAGFLPVAMEFMDGDVLRAIAAMATAPWGAEAGAALLCKLDGSAQALAADLERLVAVMGRQGANLVEHGQGHEAEEPLWELRRMMGPAMFRVRPDKISDDVAVPRSRIAAAVAGAKRIGQEQNIQVLTFGHLGDGNLHVEILFDRSDPAQPPRAQRVLEEVLRLTLSLGGTLSGEHGVGLVKKPYVHWQLGATERALMAGIKGVFDPHGIMNPAKAF